MFLFTPTLIACVTKNAMISFFSCGNNNDAMNNYERSGHQNVHIQTLSVGSDRHLLLSAKQSLTKLIIITKDSKCCKMINGKPPNYDAEYVMIHHMCH